MTDQTELIKQLMENQHRMQDAMNRLLANQETMKAENLALRNKLEAQQALREEGLVHHQEPQLTQEEMWRRAESHGGLLG